MSTMSLVPVASTMDLDPLLGFCTDFSSEPCIIDHLCYRERIKPLPLRYNVLKLYVLHRIIFIEEEWIHSTADV